MARFYLDENVARPIVALFVRDGHDVVEARALPRRADHEHLAAAAREGRILITHDREHFILLHAAWRDWFAGWGPHPQPRHAGILITPQPPVATTEQAHTLILELFGALGEERGLENRLLAWRSGRGWEEPGLQR